MIDRLLYGFSATLDGRRVDPRCIQPAAVRDRPFHDLAFTERAAAWDLRSAWARQDEVVIVLERHGRVRGYVEHVASTNAYALVWDGGAVVHVPLAFVATVRRPHFHEPLDGERVTRRAIERKPIVPLPGQMSFSGPGFDE